MSSLLEAKKKQLSQKPKLSLLFFIITLPHLLYCVIWLKADIWYNVFLENAVENMAIVASFLKCVQFFSVLYWYKIYYTTHHTFNLKKVGFFHTIISLFLFSIGQTLNAAIYKAIGYEGVYYGTKLGKEIPWVSGFPFNITPHPQYIGCILTIWAVYIFLRRQAPRESLHIAIFWSGMYVFSGIVEEFL